MNKVIYLVFMLVISANCSFSQTNINNRQSVSIETNLSAQIERHLSLYETNKSTDHIKAAVTLLNDPRHRIDVKDVSARKHRTQLWINVMTAIDDSLKSNPIELKPMPWKVTPPRDSDGFQYPPGINPSVLKDPVARSNYIAAIAAHKEESGKLISKITMARFNDDVSFFFEDYIESSYLSSNDTDKAKLQEELNVLLNKSKLSDIRQIKMRNILGLPPKDLQSK